MIQGAYHASYAFPDVPDVSWDSRNRFDDHVLMIRPVVSTIDFIGGCNFLEGDCCCYSAQCHYFWFSEMVFSMLMMLRQLLFTFVSAITIVEGLQYFTRMGIFKVDDILLNPSGIWALRSGKWR